MHRHDLDLIAAYASGHLEDEARARELVASCDECRSEYQLHLSIRGELGDLEQPIMTAAERAALHRDLWTDLRAPSPASSPAVGARTPWWYRWSAAAAGLFLVVGLVTVLANPTATEDVFETIGNELTTDGSPRLEDGEAPAAPGESDAGGPDTTAAGEMGPEGQPGVVGSDGAADDQAYLEMIDRARESESAQYNNFTSQDAAADTAACLRAAGLAGQRTIGEVDTDTPYLLVIPADEPFDPEGRITVVDSATCEVVHVDVGPNPPE